jgi:hypothetical protein
MYFNFYKFLISTYENINVHFLSIHLIHSERNLGTLAIRELPLCIK